MDVSNPSLGNTRHTLPKPTLGQATMIQKEKRDVLSTTENPIQGDAGVGL